MDDVMNFETKPITEKLETYLDTIKLSFEDKEFRKKLTNSNGEPVSYEDFCKGDYDRNVLFK